MSLSGFEDWTGTFDYGGADPWFYQLIDGTVDASAFSDGVELTLDRHMM